MKSGWLCVFAALACAEPDSQPEAQNVDSATSTTPLPSPSRVDTSLLKGPWSPDGGNFALAIGDTTILFEFDMKDHPYTLRGDTLVIDFQDPTLGVQKKLILKLTKDTLAIQDVAYGGSETLIRPRQ